MDREPAMVPVVYPFGSITDGSCVCSRCGQTLTGCYLCAGEVMSLIRLPPPPLKDYLR